MNVFMLTDRLRHRGLLLLSLLIAAALTLSACDLVGNDTDDEAQEQQTQQTQAEAAEQAEAAAAAPSPRPSAQQPPAEDRPEPPPTAAGGGAGANAYSIAFPSLAFVMTADAVATGLVISDGYVLVDEQSLHARCAGDCMFAGESLLYNNTKGK